ncbi:MAG: hypothetical protein NTY51_11370 [Deltaproteobacteria bacterium]|nr:hypothetical protein [Deltaproteobacteria bacterium]
MIRFVDGFAKSYRPAFRTIERESQLSLIFKTIVTGKMGLGRHEKYMKYFSILVINEIFDIIQSG